MGKEDYRNIEEAILQKVETIRTHCKTTKIQEIQLPEV